MAEHALQNQESSVPGLDQIGIERGWCDDKTLQRRPRTTCRIGRLPSSNTTGTACLIWTTRI